jgi:hypothetical protein
MSHGAVSRRGNVSLVIVAVVALALLVPGVALAAGTPSVTIVGPGMETLPSPSASPTTAAPAIHDAEADLYLQDNEWGTDKVRFSNDGGATWSTPEDWSAAASPYRWWYLYSGLDLTLRLDGPHAVTMQFSKDGGTTWEATSTATTLVDEQAPVVSAPDGYWNNHYPYTLSAHDQIGLSGVESLWYRVDVGETKHLTSLGPLGTSAPLTTSFELVGETGTAHSIDYLARDYAGNYSSYRLATAVRAVRTIAILNGTSAYVVIDRTPPTVKARGAGKGWHRSPVVVSFSASDTTAGVGRIEYSITRVKAKKHSAWTSGNSVVVTQSGRYKVWYRAVDDAQPTGNASAAKYVIVRIR